MSIINTIVRALQINTSKYEASYGLFSLQTVHQVLERIQNCPQSVKNNTDIGLLAGGLGDELRAAYSNWDNFVSKYEMVIYHNSELMTSTSYRICITERVNKFEREFNFAM